MARLKRYFAPHTALHIIQRGNNRQCIFNDEQDHHVFREFLRDAASSHEVSIHAYVFMPNHFHLLVTPSAQDGAAKTLQSLGRRYVWYFNLRHQRTGTLWEGRYRATAVDNETYLMACHRYIELNPVRAGLVDKPQDFHWSSHRHNAHGVADGIVTPHPVYENLARSSGKRLVAYRAMFAGDERPEAVNEIRSATHRGWALGGEEFRKRIEAISGRRSLPLPAGKKRPPVADRDESDSTQ